MISKFFELIVALRNLYYDNTKNSFSSQIPVISIGNISTGGTGKTPTCIYICSQLIKYGFEPICIGRNVNSSDFNTIYSDPISPKNSKIIGDELALIQSKVNIPILSTFSKVKAALEYEEYFLTQFKNPLYVIDDGFQHRALRRNIDVVLIDKESIQDSLLPFGRNREKLQSLQRADIVLNFSGDENTSLLKKYCKNVFVASKKKETAYPIVDLKVDENSLKPLQKVFVLSSIAKPKQFIENLQLEYTICGSIEFKDHYFYSISDIEKIGNDFTISGADSIVTTEKDLVKLELFPDFCGNYPIHILPISLQIDNEVDFLQLIYKLLHNENSVL